MCVCALQTKEQKNFTYDEIANMFAKNPHGAGMMWNDGKSIKYRKGYFDVDSFYNDYIAIRALPTTQDIAVHMRIGTGSNIDIANCHPFPISSVPKRIKSSHGSCDVGVMMNGIIGASTKEFSDTALFVMKNLKSYYDTDRRFFLHFNRQQNILFENEIYGCRFILMSKEGSKLFGYGWSNYENKAEVSNRYWIPKKVSDYNFYYSRINSYFDSYDYDGDDLPWCDKPTKANRFATKKTDKRHKSYIDYLNEAVV